MPVVLDAVDVVFVLVVVVGEVVVVGVVVVVVVVGLPFGFGAGVFALLVVVVVEVVVVEEAVVRGVAVVVVVEPASFVAGGALCRFSAAGAHAEVVADTVAWVEAVSEPSSDSTPNECVVPHVSPVIVWSSDVVAPYSAPSTKVRYRTTDGSDGAAHTSETLEAVDPVTVNEVGGGGAVPAPEAAVTRAMHAIANATNVETVRGVRRVMRGASAGPVVVSSPVRAIVSAPDPNAIRVFETWPTHRSGPARCSRSYRIVKPASTGTTAPVSRLAASEASQTIAAATSAASTSDPSGWCGSESAS